jgi:hypothetical protein
MRVIIGLTGNKAATDLKIAFHPGCWNIYVPTLPAGTMRQSFGKSVVRASVSTPRFTSLEQHIVKSNSPAVAQKIARRQERIRCAMES